MGTTMSGEPSPASVPVRGTIRIADLLSSPKERAAFNEREDQAKKKRERGWLELPSTKYTKWLRRELRKEFGDEFVEEINPPKEYPRKEEVPLWTYDEEDGKTSEGELGSIA